MAAPSRSSHIRIALALSLGLAAWPVRTATTAEADEPPGPGIASFRVEEDVSAWALDEGTGRLFAALAGGDAVVEVDPATGASPARFAVAKGPTELFIKGRRLVVACPSTSSLHVVDLRTNKVAGQVQLSGKGPYALFGSKAANPYVYAICNTGGAWWDGEVFQVDLDALAVRNRVPVQQWGQSHPVHVAMSDDGRRISPDARGASMPSGGDLMAVDEEKPSFLGVRHLHESFGPTVAGPHNRWWALGSSLFARDLTGPIRTFAGSPVAIHPTLDLVASLTDAAGKPLVPPSGRAQAKGPVGLAFQALSTARDLGRVALGPIGDGEPPQPGPGAGPQNGRPGPGDPFLRFDAARGRLVCAWRRQGYVLELERLGIDPRPLLQLDVPTQVAVEVGDTLRVPLTLANPALKGKATLGGDSGPEGARVVGDELIWAPGGDSVGIHRVVVTARADDSADSATIEVRVGLGLVDLEIAARGMAVDTRRPRVVLWGPRRPENGRIAPRMDVANPALLVVVDTEQGRVVARHELVREVRSLVSVDGAIIYAPADGTFLYRIDPDRAGEPVRVFLDAPARDLAVVPGPRLAAIPQAGRPRFYDPDTLRPSAADGAPGAAAASPTETSGWNPGLIAHLPGDLIRVGARVRARHGGAPRCLTGPLNLPPLLEGPSSSNTGLGQGPEVWGRRASQQTLTDWRGNQVTRWNAERATILTDLPAAVLSRVEDLDQGRGVRELLEYRDLVQGNLLAAQVLDEGPRGRQMQMVSSIGGGHLFGAVRGKMALVRNDRLHLAPIPREAIARAPVPVHIEYPRAPLAIALGQEVKLALKAGGGTGKLTFEMLRDVPGVGVDRSSGTLRISAADAWNARGTRGQLGGERMMPGLREAYRELTGEPLDPGRLPLGLSVTVIARDEEGQQGRLELSMIVLVPRQEATTPPPTSAGPAPAPVARAATGEPSTAAIPERLRQIDDRLRHTEAMLADILRKLDRLEPAAPGAGKSEAPKR